MIRIPNPDPFFWAIQAIICFCVCVLFLAVFLDFRFYSRKERVQMEKKSIVETGTMTLFFIVFYLILRSGAGIIPVGPVWLKSALMIAGTIFVAAGCAANIYGRLNLGRNWANQIKIYQEQTLVTAGIYGIVRHPLYSSIILMFFGACLAYRNLAAFLAVTLVFVPFMAFRAKQEENLLQRRFPEYEEYRHRTGMFFPKIRKQE